MGRIASMAVITVSLILSLFMVQAHPAPDSSAAPLPASASADLTRRQPGLSCWTNYGPQDIIETYAAYTNFCYENWNKQVGEQLTGAYDVGVISVIPCNGKRSHQMLDYDTCEGIFEWIRGNCTDVYNGPRDIEMSGGQYADSSSCLLYQLVLNGVGLASRNIDVAHQSAASTMSMALPPASNLEPRHCESSNCPSVQCAPVNDDQPPVWRVYASYVNFCNAHQGEGMADTISGFYDIGQFNIWSLPGGDAAATLQVHSCIAAYEHIRLACNTTIDGDDWTMTGGQWQDDNPGYVYSLALNNDNINKRKEKIADIAQITPVNPAFSAKDISLSTLGEVTSSIDIGKRSESVQCDTGYGSSESWLVLAEAEDFCSRETGDVLLEPISYTSKNGTLSIGYCSGYTQYFRLNYTACLDAFQIIIASCSDSAQDGKVIGGSYTDPDTCIVYENRPSGSSKKDRALEPLVSDVPKGDSYFGCFNGLTVDLEAFLPQIDYFCTAFDGFVLQPNTNMSMTGGVSGDPQLSATFMALTDTQFNHCNGPKTITKDVCIEAMQYTVEYCSAENGQAYGGWDSADACLYYVNFFSALDDASRRSPVNNLTSTVNATESDLEKRTTSGYCFNPGASLDSIDLTSYIDIWCNGQNGHVIYPGDLYLQTGDVDGAGVSLGMGVTLASSQICPQSYTIDAGTCASVDGLLWMPLNCHNGGNTYGGFLNNGCVTWEIFLVSTVARVETNASQAAHGSSAAKNRSIEGRQIGNINCSEGPKLFVNELDDAITAFCNNVSSFLPLGATQSAGYNLTSGGEVVLSRTSGCTDVTSQTQLGYGLCISPFQDIVDQCQDNPDQLSSVSTGGSTSVWDCVEYTISVEHHISSQRAIRDVAPAPAANASHDDITCNNPAGEEASVAATRNLTSLYCDLWHGTLLPPNSTLSGQAPIGGIDDACTYANFTVSNGANCGHLLVVAPRCEKYFGQVAHSCCGSSSSTYGGAYLTDGCQDYNLTIIDIC